MDTQNHIKKSQFQTSKNNGTLMTQIVMIFTDNIIINHKYQRYLRSIFMTL